MRWRRPLTAALALSALVLGSSLGVGSAATLGGISAASLISSNSSSTPGDPAILACDNFTGTNNSSMAGRTVVNSAACSARVWASNVGSWTIQTDRAESDGTASAVATVNTASTNGSAEVDLYGLNQGSRLGGLVASHNGTSTYLAAVMINSNPDRVELRIVVNGTSTTIATSNPPFAATNNLRLKRSGSSVVVSVNAATTISATLNPSQVTSLGSGGRFGLFGGNQQVQFDDFLATSP